MRESSASVPKRNAAVRASVPNKRSYESEDIASLALMHEERDKNDNGDRHAKK